MVKKNLLIVGNGYIASSFVNKFINKYNFIISSRNKNQLIKKSNISYIGNLLDKESNFDNRYGITDILFTASASSFKKSNKLIVDNFISEFEFFLDKVNYTKIRNIIYLSSSSLYGTDKENYSFHEEDLIIKDTLYQKEKYYSEKILKKIFSGSKRNYKILRISNPYGNICSKIHKIGVINKIFLNMIDGKKSIIKENGKPIRDYIFIDDLINYVDLAINSSSEQTKFNIGTGTGTSLENIMSLLKEADSRFDFILEKSKSKESNCSILDISKAKKIFKYAPRYTIDKGLIYFKSSINKC